MMGRVNLRLLTGGNIITMEDKNPRTSCLLYEGEKILAASDESSIREKVNTILSNEKDVKLEERDLNGACVVPGFIDAHLHPILCIYWKSQLNLSSVRSFKDLSRQLIEEDKNKKKGEWIFAVDLMEDMFEEIEERHFPNRWDLDKILSNRPIICMRHDGHILSVNSLVLEKIMNLELN